MIPPRQRRKFTAPPNCWVSPPTPPNQRPQIAMEFILQPYYAGTQTSSPTLQLKYSLWPHKTRALNSSLDRLKAQSMVTPNQGTQPTVPPYSRVQPTELPIVKHSLQPHLVRDPSQSWSIACSPTWWGSPDSDPAQLKGHTLWSCLIIRHRLRSHLITKPCLQPCMNTKSSQ